MATEGMRNYYSHQRVGRREQEMSNYLKHNNSELWQIVSLDTLPNPAELFSERNCDVLAKKWRVFCSLYPQAKNDLQTMLVFLGLAHPYPKYRMHLTPVDLAAEAYAMGVAKLPGHMLLEKHGLFTDPIYGYMRPNANPNDPNSSPVFIMFEREMSGGRDLLPPDCKSSGSF